MTKIVEINPIVSKTRKHHGVVYPGSATEYTARITNPSKNDAIIEVYKVSGYNSGVGRSFNVGDIATYDSFNLIYTGEITKITEKTVTIVAHRKSHRLSLEQFAWRNYNFDADETARKNSETMMYI